MKYKQVFIEWCLIFNHCIKILGNKPKLVFFYDLRTTLSTDMVDYYYNKVKVF